jgi:hypothetical protein
VPESEWNDEQQGWMLALAEYRAMRCAGCGQDVRESMSHERDGIDYQTSKLRCRACDVLAVARDAYDGKRPEAVHWYVKRKR